MTNLPKSGVELVAENAEAFLATMGRAGNANEQFGKSAQQAASATNTSLDAIADAARRSSGLYQDAAGRWRTASGRFASDAEKAAAGVESLPRAVDDAADRIHAKSAVFEGFFDRIGEGMADMAANAAAALGEVAVDTVQVAADFESGLAVFGSVAGDALGEAGLSIDDFREKALQLGAETQFSADQALQGFTELVKGGRSAAEAMEEVDAALNLVAAGGLPDVATGADILAKQLGVWADSGVTAANVTDLLARAANASTVDVAELHDGLLQAAGTAKATGVEYEDFVTTMAAIAPAFSSAQEAGTSYRNFLVRLQPSTKDAAAAMAELGLLTEDGKSKFFDATGAFIGGEQAAQLLQESLAGLSDAQRQQALQTIFGNDAMNAAVALAEQGGQGYRDMAEGMDLAGSAADQAAERNQGFNFAIEQLKGSFETLQIIVGTAVLPMLTDLTNEVTNGVNVVMAFAQEVFGAEDPLQALTTALGLGTGELGELGTMAQQIAEENLQRLTSAWEEDVLPALEIVTDFVVEDLQPVLEDVAEVVLPLLGSALDVAAATWENVLVPALQLAWNVFDRVLFPVIRTLTGWLSDNLPPAIAIVADFLTETLLPAAGEVYDFFNDNVVPLLEAVAGVLQAVVGRAIEEAAKLLTETLLPAAEDIVGVIGESLNPLLEDLVEWFDRTTGGIDGIVSAIQDAITWLNDLARAIAELPDMPSDLIPGSPTPFERGLNQTGAAASANIPRFAALAATLESVAAVTPDATASQYQTTSNVTTINNTWAPQMPIYTNNSPGALQESMAVITAMATAGA